MKKTFALIACILFGPFFAWRGASELVTAYGSKSWPTVEGTIKSSDVTESRGSRGRRTYTPAVKYQYVVEGRYYTGDRINSGDRGMSSIKDAMTMSMQYQEERPVTVHYNPKSPSVALLEVGTTSDNWIVFGFGMLMTGSGLFGLRNVWQRFQGNEFLKPTDGF